MAVPKRKTSKSKRNMRRAHDALRPTSSTACPQCKEVVKPHCVCRNCGYYGGRAVMPVAEATAQ